jgi:hypothetical protein
VGDARGTWGPRLEALSDDFTVVTWDEPGTGRSADPPGRFRLPGVGQVSAVEAPERCNAAIRGFLGGAGP